MYEFLGMCDARGHMLPLSEAEVVEESSRAISVNREGLLRCGNGSSVEQVTRPLALEELLLVLPLSVNQLRFGFICKRQRKKERSSATGTRIES